MKQRLIIIFSIISIFIFSFSNKTEKTSISYNFEYNKVKYIYQKAENQSGITDINGNVIIPAKFDYIVYPGELYKNMVEVCKNGKFGLYSFPEGKEIAPPEYDEFYPVYDERILAYYKKGNTYGIIKKNNSTTGDFSKYSKSPFENGLIAKWNFSLISNSYIIDNSSNYNGDYAIAFLPSFMKTFYDNLKLEGGEFDGGTDIDYFLISYVKSMNINNENYYFIKINRSGGGWDSSVDYAICSKNITEIFYSAPTASSVMLNEEEDIELKKLTQSMFRIKDPNNFLTHNKKDYPETTLDDYAYYQIINGKLERLENNRFFPFTEYELITPEFFEGLFIGEEFLFEGYNPKVWVYKHLSIKDLDVMRNEIFATRGYTFSTDKWKNFFNQFSWYKPKNDNANVKLNDIEKENIDIILKEKARMKGNEAKYLKKFKASVNNAG